jgi:hypothetical protein
MELVGQRKSLSDTAGLADDTEVVLCLQGIGEQIREGAVVVDEKDPLKTSHGLLELDWSITRAATLAVVKMTCRPMSIERRHGTPPGCATGLLARIQDGPYARRPAARDVFA